MPKGTGIYIDGRLYNVVQDHETYVVSDVPAHPDSDSRMERRVHYDSFTKGYLKRRAAANPMDQSIYSMNIYNRIEKAGEGLWFSWGGDTRMGDRIFGQRQVGTSQAPASKPLLFGDSTIYSYIACLQHIYSINGVVAGVQQITQSLDLTGQSPAVNVTDAVSFNGRVYVATAQLTNGMPDPAKSQPMWVWDQTSPSSNWTHPPAALSAPVWPASQGTTLASPLAASGATSMTVAATTGMPGTTIAAASDGASLPQGTINVASTYGFPASGTMYVVTSGGLKTVTYTGKTDTSFTGCVGGTGTMTLGNAVQRTGNFNVTIDNEILTVTFQSGSNYATVLTVVTRGVLGSPVTAHQSNAVVTYNPAVTVIGTAGTTRWQYYVIAVLTGQDSPPSTTQTITTGASVLSTINSNQIIFNTVAGQSYVVFRVYAGGSPNSVGIIGSPVAGTGSPATFTDTGLPVVSLHYQVTPQFAIGDTGSAISFAVIRNTLWRAAGPRMWAWDGQQATWTGESVIGDPNTNITALDVYQDGLIIFKQDGIYTMNRTGDVFPLFPGFKTLGLNPRPLGQWQGQYYFASDVGMVWEWNGDQVKSIGFDFAEAYPFPDGTFGLPNAATKGVGLPNYFLVGFNKWQSNNNAAFFLAYDGVGWHPFHYDPNFQVSGLGFTGGNVLPANPTIQFGKVYWNNTSFGVSYLTQPTLDPYLVTNYDTVPQTVFLPVDSGIIADEWKVLEGIRVFVENPSAGQVRVAYCSDDNIFTQTYVDIGAPQNDRTTIQTFIPSGVLPVYRKIMFRIIVTPTATSATPIVRLVMHRYKQRESQRKSWTINLFIEEGQMNPNRNRERRTAQQMLRHLNDARKNQNLVKFKDLVGDEYMVYVESVGESLKTYRSKNFDTSFTAKVVLVETAEVGNE